MKRILPMFALMMFAAVAFGVEATTKPVPKPYTTQEVIANPDIETLVKAMPKSFFPSSPKETDDEEETRRKGTLDWQRANTKGKNIQAEAVVISETIASFRIKGMEETTISLAGDYRGFKQGDRVLIKGAIKTVNAYYRGDDMWISFRLTEPTASLVKK